MTFSGLRHVAWQATKRLLVALLMAGVAVAVMGGSRWFVLRRMIGVLFFIDLYGTVALLWLAIASHRLGRRMGDGAHAPFFGATAGILFFQHWFDGSRSLALAVLAATMLPALVPRSRARVVAAGGLIAGLGYYFSPWSSYRTPDPFWAPLVAALCAAPFFVLSWRLAVPAANKKPWRFSRVTLVLVALAFLEFLRIPTSLAMLGEVIEIHWSGN